MDIYKEAFLKMARENRKEALLNISKYEAKIKAQAIRLGIDPETYYQSMLLNPVPELYMKQPKTQNITETIAKNYIESQLPDCIVEILPKRSSQSLYVVLGRICSYNEVAGMSTRAKSIDMLITYRNYRLYVNHKYIHESGGAQDNQFRDMREFIDAALLNNYTAAEKIIFVALTDGDYFTKPAKRQILEALPQKENVWICNVYELVKKLNTL